MNSRIRHRVVGLGLLGIVVFGAGGCPMATPLGDGTLLGPEPGTYYVERVDGKLLYYQLAELRGDDDRWAELSDESGWFDGPGFYRLSADFVWSPDENAEGLTLDDLIQLNDPPPAPPE